MTKNHPTKKCPECKENYTPTGPAQTFCAICGEERRLQKMRDRHYRTYVRKGYNQRGESNNAWAGGIGIYRQIKIAEECERCGRRDNLCIHHKDTNRRNNSPDNLECLCKRCHQIEHECWKNLPQKGKKSKRKSL